ncbi:citrate lyase subunit beta/citryl-CoA lyase [Tepidamorphus gemmatus]|uniref:Citrate lyase subunit beta/citryl-CoA lyase n=1 Tax=Tepidamorphus gemmatus TaxID=747076 RepID=A0A4R3MG95_9HYPH|nr:citrate lyase subunit beta/citryl-CoA lyase [Tepidamorphus gemmatus]
MPLRSLLFVPGDSPRKFARAMQSGADALILDLEDSVAPDLKAQARDIAARLLAEARGQSGRPRLYVRVNALDTGLTDADLDAVIPHEPDGIVLPKSSKGADVMLLDAKVTTSEALAGIEDGRTRILAIVTETAASLFAIGTYDGSSARLEGMTWGGEDLSADIGAFSNRDAAGRYTDVYRLARALCLAGAAAAGVLPIDAVYTDFRDAKGLRRECDEAVRDGFVAKMAIHPDQVSVINEAFTPSEAAVREAEAVLRAMSEAGETGVASLDGQMIDRPHVRRAERILQRARSTGRLGRA